MLMLITFELLARPFHLFPETSKDPDLSFNLHPTDTANLRFGCRFTDVLGPSIPQVLLIFVPISVVFGPSLTYLRVAFMINVFVAILRPL
jgi:hypothetical protein